MSNSLALSSGSSDLAHKGLCHDMKPILSRSDAAERHSVNSQPSSMGPDNSLPSWFIDGWPESFLPCRFQKPDSLAPKLPDIPFPHHSWWRYGITSLGPVSWLQKVGLCECPVDYSWKVNPLSSQLSGDKKWVGCGWGIPLLRNKAGRLS